MEYAALIICVESAVHTALFRIKGRVRVRVKLRLLGKHAVNVKCCAMFPLGGRGVWSVSGCFDMGRLAVLFCFFPFLCIFLVHPSPTECLAFYRALFRMPIFLFCFLFCIAQSGISAPSAPS
ncbi:unnamed protein product, partial [Discosporangium mesarthrocarpum]